MPSKVKSGNWIVVIIFLSFFLFSIFAVSSQSPAPKAVLIIQNFEGVAETSKDGKVWNPAIKATELPAFSFARTGPESTMAFQYNDGADVILLANSEMQFTSASRYTAMTGRLHLMKGSLELKNQKEKIQLSADLSAEPASRSFWQDMTGHFIHVGPEGSLRMTLAAGEKFPVIQKARGLIKIESLFPRSSKILESKSVKETVEDPAP